MSTTVPDYKDLELEHRHSYLIAAWELVLVPYEYHTQIPFLKCECCQRNNLLTYYPQNNGEQNNPNSKLGCFWQVAHTTEHCLEGGEGNFPFEIGNMPKKPFEAL